MTTINAGDFINDVAENAAIGSLRDRLRPDDRQLAAWMWARSGFERREFEPEEVDAAREEFIDQAVGHWLTDRRGHAAEGAKEAGAPTRGGADAREAATPARSPRRDPGRGRRASGTVWRPALRATPARMVAAPGGPEDLDVGAPFATLHGEFGEIDVFNVGEGVLVRLPERGSEGRLLLGERAFDLGPEGPHGLRAVTGLTLIEADDFATAHAASPTDHPVRVG